MKPPVRIGLIGLGTVGTGVVQMLRENRALIEAKVGAPVHLAMVCDRSATAAQIKKLNLEAVFTRKAEDVLINPDIDILVELIGGYEPARTYVLKALHAGKHVVTANKAILAKYWSDLFEHARIYRRLIYFEGAVGGGIPVIQALNEGLAGNRITKIVGILNGTTNFVLTRMSQDGLTYASALKEAQMAGFAEANPAFDVEGIDVAHKIAILASIASGTRVRLEDVVTEGITHIDPRDMAFVQREFGYVVKLLGIARFDKSGSQVEVRVHPALIPAKHPFANVQNEYNAVVFEGDAVGDVMLYGRGAGRMAAASAVISDITYVARQVAAGTAGKLPYVSGEHRKAAKAVMKADMQSRFYLRFTVADRAGVLAGISGILSKCGISISGVYQPEHGFDSRMGASIMILTHRVREGVMEKALKTIAGHSYVRAKTVFLRIEE
jgi:homoserine dehydrogenase